MWYFRQCLDAGLRATFQALGRAAKGDCHMLEAANAGHSLPVALP